MNKFSMSSNKQSNKDSFPQELQNDKCKNSIKEEDKNLPEELLFLIRINKTEEVISYLEKDQTLNILQENGVIIQSAIIKCNDVLLQYYIDYREKQIRQISQSNDIYARRKAKYQLRKFLERAYDLCQFTPTTEIKEILKKYIPLESDDSLSEESDIDVEDLQKMFIKMGLYQSPPFKQN